MDKTRFWQLIEATYDADADTHSENLKAALVRLDATEIAAFGVRFEELEVAAYRWDLWAVAYIIHDGCSDDGFNDFCLMLIRRGRKFYEEMMSQPETAALRHNIRPEDFDDWFDSGFSEAYEIIAKRELLAAKTVWPTEPSGSKWKEEELPKLYPRLSEKFG